MKTSYSSKSSEAGKVSAPKSSLNKKKSVKASSSKSSSSNKAKTAASSKSSKRGVSDDVVSSSPRKSKTSSKIGGVKVKQAVVTPEKSKKVKSKKRSHSNDSSKDNAPKKKSARASSKTQSLDSSKNKSSMSKSAPAPPKKKSAPAPPKKKSPPLDTMKLQWWDSTDLFRGYLKQMNAENDLDIIAELTEMSFRDMIEVIASETTPKALLPAIFMVASELGISPLSLDTAKLMNAPKAALVKKLADLSIELSNK